MGRRPEGEGRRSPSSKITMVGLAQLAGVAPITVSRALNGSELVRAEVRERIQALAREHDYRFNLAAHSLRLAKSQTVAVVIAASGQRPVADAYPMILLSGIVQRMSAAGYIVVLAPRERASSPEVRAADGAILLGQGSQEDSLRLMEGIGSPLVVWGSVRRPSAASTIVVGSDNCEGGRAAAEYLLEQGRRNLVFLGDITHAELADRFSGFALAVAQAGAAIVATCAAAFTSDGGHSAIGDLTAKGVKFDGVFCCSDLIAIGAVRSLKEAGVAIPEEVSVVGYDDSPLAAEFDPPITSVQQDWIEGGRLLADKLLKAIKGEPAPSEMLPVRLVRRST